MRCFHNTFTDIYFHLAAEEYLLKQETDSVFMLWQDTPSVVMGKHQSVQLEVNREWAEEQQIQIARRFSGGGAVYHDLGNVNLTFIETVSRLPDFSLYLHRILDFLKQIGLPAKGDERLGIYLDGLKISGSAQCVHKNRVLYHCTLLYDTNLTALNKVLNPERNIETGVASSVYAVPSVRSEVTNISRYLPMETVDHFKEMLFDPLGMKDTAAIFPDEQTKNRLVTLYAKDPDGNLVPGPDFFDKKHLPGKENEAGWARLYSSVEDYSRLLQMLACGGVYDGTRLMSSTTIDLMRTNGLTREQLLDFPDKGYGYGLGFRTVIDPAAGDLNGSIGAFGWTGGFGSWCEADPAEGLSIVYMHNLIPNDEQYYHPRVRTASYGLL